MHIFTAFVKFSDRLEGQMIDDIRNELRDGMSDEERIRYRDSLSDEQRREIMNASHDRTMQWIFSGGIGSVEARLTQIEKRLETLELKR
jgi:hypothetical protein